MAQTSQFTIISDPGALPAARRRLRAYCAEWAPLLAEPDVEGLELAFHEAVCNIIEHAYGGRRDETISVTLSVNDGGITALLVDCGCSFAPTAVALPKQVEQADGGMGLYVIHRCCDEATYFVNDLGENCLRLTRGPRVSGR